MASAEANQLSLNNHYPFAFLKHLNEIRVHDKPNIVSNSVEFRELQQLLIENTAHEYVKIVANIFINLIYCVQLLRNYINEYSPLVLFSWWRNKIS